MHRTVAVVCIFGITRILEAHEDISWVSPIRFAYDWLKDAPSQYLSAPPLEYTSDFPAALFPPDYPNGKGDFTREALRPGNITSSNDENAFDISPLRAGLPWATGLMKARQSRRNGVSLARIASHELLTEEEGRFTKFATYLFPEADEQRMRLLAATITPGKCTVKARSTWCETILSKRLGNDVEDGANETPLHALLSYTVRELKAEDQRRATVDRRYILACVKFSLRFSVCIDDPKLARDLRLVSDHMSLVNDLASYDKEKRAYDSGKVCYLINAVDVVQRLLALTTPAAAKSLAYSMQLQVEAEMKEELGHLVVSRELSTEELEFVDAALVMAAGNVFYFVKIWWTGSQDCHAEWR
ncbi:hypothetical protein CSOJ01_12220 [Colletotrichum sojae]|uniref:Terpenoid synthase n=1 Tax=Colletotrichum sojae TaxID=2175907 RepID=A0A8H6IVF6_9PEZI|nr:hypothetical protein CSOJ01_12220 [Colletotrichum sojae]